MNKSGESSILLSHCVLVLAPLIPLVALVEIPPQNDDLSNNTTLSPFSNTVLTAGIPAKPRSTTMAWSEKDAIAARLVAKKRSAIDHESSRTQLKLEVGRECCAVECCAVLCCIVGIACCLLLCICVCYVLSVVCVVCVVKHSKKDKHGKKKRLKT